MPPEIPPNPTNAQKVEAWLGTNWWPFGLGAATGVVVTIIAHLIKLI